MLFRVCVCSFAQTSTWLTRALASGLSSLPFIQNAYVFHEKKIKFSMNVAHY
jgi:hypothetical protein